MTAHYARLSDTTVRRHWEQARKVNIGGEHRDPRSGWAACRGRMGQTAAFPSHPGASQWLLWTSFGAVLSTCQCLPDMSDVPHYHRVPSPTPTTPPTDPADHLQSRSRRPDPHGGDEPPASPTTSKRSSSRLSRTRTNSRSPMPADNTDRDRHRRPPTPRADPSQGHPGTPRTRPRRAPRLHSRSSPARRVVSRSWLYNEPDIRNEIQRLREATRHAPSHPYPPHSEPPQTHYGDDWRPRTNASANSPTTTSDCDANSPTRSATTGQREHQHRPTRPIAFRNDLPLLTIDQLPCVATSTTPSSTWPPRSQT